MLNLISGADRSRLWTLDSREAQSWQSHLLTDCMQAGLSYIVIPATFSPAIVDTWILQDPSPDDSLEHLLAMLEVRICGKNVC